MTDHQTSPVGEEAERSVPLQYRKKPVVIEAIQWPGTKFDQTPPGWFRDAMYAEPGTPGFLMRIGDKIVIETLEGQVWAAPGDWIIRGVKGELYPCKPEIFAETYEVAAPTQPKAQVGVSIDTPELQTVLDEFAYRASERRAMGGDFGSAEAEGVAESALIDYIDAWASSRSAPAAGTVEKDAERLAFIAERGAAVRAVENARSNLAVWDHHFPYGDAGRLKNLRLSIDFAIEAHNRAGNDQG